MKAKYVYEKSGVYGEYDIYLILSNYSTYNNQIVDCECVEEITEESVNIKTNKSFSLYENTNHYFDDEEVILHAGFTANEYISSNFEKNILKNEVFKLDDGICYKLDVFENKPDITDIWAIINVEDNDIWWPFDESGIPIEGIVPDVITKDWCGTDTNEKYIRLKDINPYSLTYGKIIEQLKCHPI